MRDKKKVLTQKTLKVQALGQGGNATYSIVDFMEIVINTLICE